MAMLGSVCRGVSLKSNLGKKKELIMTGVQREIDERPSREGEGKREGEAEEEDVFGFLKLFRVEVLDCISGLYIQVDIFTSISEQAKAMEGNCQTHCLCIKGV